jgi:hypothetical protein
MGEFMNDAQYFELRTLVQKMVGKTRELEGEILALQSLLLTHDIVTQSELIGIRQRARNKVFDPNLGMSELVSGKDPGELIPIASSKRQ